MTVRLAGRRGLPIVDRAMLGWRARRVLRELGRRRSELSVQLVDDPDVAELNLRYRGIEGPTDVLAFPLLEGPHAEHAGALLGDVVISLETAERQARRARRSLDEEAAKLLIHGTLHLLGHDHQHAAETRKMRAEERRLWRCVRERADP
jgi:probable rRNA maturation factor